MPCAVNAPNFLSAPVLQVKQRWERDKVGLFAATFDGIIAPKRSSCGPPNTIEIAAPKSNQSDDTDLLRAPELVTP